MPIVEPPSFKALNLVSFQINPHYLDPDPDSKHMGESREERILQFLEDNDTPVVGLREGAMVRLEHGATILKGSPARASSAKCSHQLSEAGKRLDDLIMKPTVLSQP